MKFKSSATHPSTNGRQIVTEAFKESRLTHHLQLKQEQATATLLKTL